MKSFAEIDIENGGNYLKLLSAVSKLSGLFSESSTPFINYRVAENIFCRSFEADNLSRSDTAFDANYNKLGVGLKTFISSNDKSSEKIAEFNQLSRELKEFSGKNLAIKLAEYRNERIELARRLYNIENSLYHIVARKDSELILFETDYDKIDSRRIKSVKERGASLQFEDGRNTYSFNYSKSTLFRQFITPKEAFKLPVEIIKDPFSLLLKLFEEKEFDLLPRKYIKGVDYVILPLYGYKKGKRFVFEKSGINQWNAKPRPNQERRGLGEIEIRIPVWIHKKYVNFFPPKDKIFNLQVPTEDNFKAKVCQENRKALMTNPNKDISDWLLRTVLHLDEGELATIEKLDKLGFDSVIITKTDNENYKIDIMKTDSFENFKQ